MQLRLPRPEDQRDLVLYLPDEILVVDHMRQIAAIHRYEFEFGERSTSGLPRSTALAPCAGTSRPAGRASRKRSWTRRICCIGRARKGGICARRLVRGRGRAAAGRNRCADRPSVDVSAAAPGQPGALRRADQSRGGRVSRRGLARDVRPRRGPPDRDLPDQRHDRAWPRPGRGRRAHPRTAQLRQRTRAS